MVQTTHPEHRCARSAPLSASRIEGRENGNKKEKKCVYPLCGEAGERVAQRSVGRVSRRRRSKAFATFLEGDKNRTTILMPDKNHLKFAHLLHTPPLHYKIPRNKYHRSHRQTHQYIFGKNVNLQAVLHVFAMAYHS